LKTKEKEHLPDGFNLPDFVQIVVIPFFYNQSHYETYRKWAWGGYSHGELGYLEGYGESSEPATVESVCECIKLLRKYGQKWSLYGELLTKKGKLKIHHYYCFCGSGRKVRKCHPEMFIGLLKLKEDIKALSLKI